MDLMGLALGVTFAGGATGKFVCGVLAERLGIIRTVLVTEAATGLGILLLLALPVTPALFLLPVLGIALNGTSSVLYGTVAELVTPERRSRVYGLFYTIGIGSRRARAAALRPPLRRGRRPGDAGGPGRGDPRHAPPRPPPPPGRRREIHPRRVGGFGCSFRPVSSTCFTAAEGNRMERIRGQRPPA